MRIDNTIEMEYCKTFGSSLMACKLAELRTTFHNPCEIIIQTLRIPRARAPVQTFALAKRRPIHMAKRVAMAMSPEYKYEYKLVHILRTTHTHITTHSLAHTQSSAHITK